MKTWKTFGIAAATAITAISLNLSTAHAQAPGRGDGPGHARMLTAQDRAALVDARIAAIKAGLKLSGEQEALFEPVEQAYRAMADARHDRMQERAAARQDRAMRGERRGEMRDRNGPERAERRAERRAEMRAGRSARGDFMEGLERRTATMTSRAAQLEDFTEAMRPFWDSLDDDQRRLAPVLMHQDMGMGRSMGRNVGMRMGERRGHGHGRHGGGYGTAR